METATIIVPTFNRANRIARTLASVLQQDYRNIEILVVDDGSTDETESVVRQVASSGLGTYRSLRYIRQENAGACVARNRGMMCATGNFLMFLDSDDLIVPSKLSQQIEQLETEQSDCSICDYDCIDDSGTIVSTYLNNRDPHEFIKSLVSPHISTLVIRTRSLPSRLQWNPSLARLQDLDFAFKYFAQLNKWSYLNKPLFRYCLHDDVRISDDYIKGVQYDELRASFASFVSDGGSTPDLRRIQAAYFCALRKHQLKNRVAALVPGRLKSLVRRLNRPHT